MITYQKLQRLIYYFRARKYRIIVDRLKRQIPFIKVKKFELKLVRSKNLCDYLEFVQYSSPLVTIILPVYNQWEYTRVCLTAIYLYTEGISYEVIVADDGSTDETLNLSDYFGNVHINTNSENLGFLRNCNVAAKRASGKYLVLLNNDTNVQPGWLDNMLEIVKNDDSVGLVGPMLLYPNGKLQEAGGIVWNTGQGGNYGNQDYPERSEYNYLKETDYISGACILVPRKVWEQLGGFDERYSPAYYEDTDLAFGVRSIGYKVVYQPLSRVIHFEGASHGKDLTTGIKRYQQENRLKFASKWQTVLQAEHCDGREQLFIARDRSKSKKIILFIDHYVPQPDRDAGSRSTFQYLELLVELGYKVKFIGDNFVDYEPYTSMLQQMGIEVLYGKWYRRNWKAWLRQNSKFIDYVYLSRPHIASKYLPFVKKNTTAKLIYCGHDLHYLREMRHYQIVGSSIDLKQSRKWEKIEKNIVSNVDVSYFFSEYEVGLLRKDLPSANIKSIPLFMFSSNCSIDAEITPSFNSRHGLLFVGGFMHAPNVDAVMWFINDVFPLIREVEPTIVFNIVGSNPPDEILNLSGDGVNILGEVSDSRLKQLYQEVRVVVAPLRFGAGVKGKVLESIEHGVPIVTTNIGAEGIQEAESALLISDNCQGFLEHVINVYSNSEVWQSTVEKGWRLLNKYYTKECAREILLEDMPIS